jgi:LPS export ABC transporter protein LptC
MKFFQARVSSCPLPGRHAVRSPASAARPQRLAGERRAAAATLIGLALLLPGASTPGPVAGAETAELAVTGMTFVQSVGDRAEMVVEADRGRLDPDSKTVHLEGVKTRVAATEERSGFELVCDTGELELETHALLATGNVRGRTGEGSAFTTSWVRYDPKREMAFTDAPVEIEDGDGVLRGGGFRYFVREGRFRLLRGATVRREN